jgi:hypothetical protein
VTWASGDPGGGFGGRVARVRRFSAERARRSITLNPSRACVTISMSGGPLWRPDRSRAFPKIGVLTRRLGTQPGCHAVSNVPVSASVPAIRLRSATMVEKNHGRSMSLTPKSVCGSKPQWPGRTSVPVPPAGFAHLSRIPGLGPG